MLVTTGSADAVDAWDMGSPVLGSGATSPAAAGAGQDGRVAQRHTVVTVRHALDPSGAARHDGQAAAPTEREEEEPCPTARRCDSQRS
ncbi:hypothetical protein GCM10009846_01620 [Agrococcus versicolor]|uniref:Uncharacterized protein n=1 Tax=Agrococcus versicolor TaxID=501482 RepID=A0ABP5ME70_9MICO